MKKVLIFGLSLIMLIIFVACGSTQDPSSELNLEIYSDEVQPSPSAIRKFNDLIESLNPAVAQVLLEDKERVEIMQQDSYWDPTAELESSPSSIIKFNDLIASINLALAQVILKDEERVTKMLQDSFWDPTAKVVESSSFAVIKLNEYFESLAPDVVLMVLEDDELMYMYLLDRYWNPDLYLQMYTEPSSEMVIELIQKAEAIYQLGNQEVLTTIKFEVQPTEELLYYDEISNYDEVVPTVFTENAINVLERSHNLGVPSILKQDDRIYRASSMCDSAATVFFNTIKSLELIEQQENKYIYEIVHIAEPIGFDPATVDEAPEIVSHVAIVHDGENFLVDEFTYPLDY